VNQSENNVPSSKWQAVQMKQKGFACCVAFEVLTISSSSGEPPSHLRGDSNAPHHEFGFETFCCVSWAQLSTEMTLSLFQIAARRCIQVKSLIPLAELHHLLAFFSRMMEFFFQNRA